MGQILFTKKFGEIEVARSWQEGPNHIALLVNGVYCHITGLPIKEKSELRDVLSGEDLKAAEHWFDHRHDEKENPPQRIMFGADGTPFFEDGTPVESPSDLVQSLKPGPLLDAALMALASKMNAKKAAESKDKLAQEKATKETAAKVADKEATKRVAAKVGAPIQKSGMKKKPGAKKPAARRSAQVG